MNLEKDKIDLFDDFLCHEMSVLSCMTDIHQNMRLSWLFRLFQEISILHTTELGMDRTKTLDKGLLWVISRQSVTVHHLPAYDERIRVITWPGKTLEILFPRYYRMESVDTGTVCAEGEAFWLLMDQKTRSFVFPEANAISIPKSSLAPEEQPFPKPFRCPEGISLSSAGTCLPRYSQIDLNGHINNANYFDMIDDLLGRQGRQIYAPRHIDAEYRSEIRSGMNIEIFCGSNPEQTTAYYEGRPAIDCSDNKKRKISPMFRILFQY